jgi:hypothetical protein
MKDLSLGASVGFTVLQDPDPTQKDNMTKNGKAKWVALLPNNEVITA